jgi:hypothetical protein
VGRSGDKEKGFWRAVTKSGTLNSSALGVSRWLGLRLASAFFSQVHIMIRSLLFVLLIGTLATFWQDAAPQHPRPSHYGLVCLTQFLCSEIVVLVVSGFEAWNILYCYMGLCRFAGQKVLLGRERCSTQQKSFLGGEVTQRFAHRRTRVNDFQTECLASVAFYTSACRIYILLNIYTYH